MYEREDLDELLSKYQELLDLLESKGIIDIHESIELGVIQK